MTTHQNKPSGLVATPAPSPGAPDSAPVRRPRGAGRGRAPDPGVEVRFDPRLELAEHLLRRSLEEERADRPSLLRQVRNLLVDARNDATPACPGVPAPRPGEPAVVAGPALLDLDEQLLHLADDQATHRARRIMHARQLLHDVRVESERTRWHDESRLRLLGEILNRLEHAPV
ncbi:hypothetical protein [Kineosporia succinea]|uniref:Uncharacterized protein n=1 Tax=Kineosporia succinea TaxID=84632 RepID=A0ABT9NWU5_9ACTN|nr:hypothetical protein [Kineosporia succinea]MDP9824892.1 hypothetical protein [Kineosporia succinea]